MRLVLLLWLYILLSNKAFPLIFTKNQDPRRYWSCQGTFPRHIFLPTEISHPKNYLMLFVNRIWNLCVINHIKDDVFNNAKNHHYIQVNIVIKSLFYEWTEKELHETLDKFWRKYKSFNNKNDLFDSNEFISNSKDIRDGNSHLCHQK